MEEKRKQLRQEMMEKRSRLLPEQVEQMSRQICHKLSELKPVQDARNIMGFTSIRNEVLLMPWLEEISAQRKILLPRVETDGNMSAVEFHGWDKIKKGSFGIAEPLGEPFNPANIDVVLTPGLVFDYQGYRLGYGKGFYDRFLKRLRPDAFICGVGYEFQVVENIYPHEADVPVHWIVTDKSELGIDWNYF